MTDLALFDQPAPPPRRVRDRHGAAHRCSCCGARTYRRIRRMPTMGKVDDRCQRCTDRGYEPGVTREVTG